MHIAVTGMHVQRNPDAAFEHPLVNGIALFKDRGEGTTCKNILQLATQLRLPAGAQAVVLQLQEQLVHVIQPALPLGLDAGDQRQGLTDSIFQQFGRRNFIRVIMPPQRQAALAEKGFQFVAQLELVAQAQLDVDALNTIGVFSHARQRNHHVLVDLERVGVLGDGGRPLAVQPEFFSRLGADSNKTLAIA